MKKLIALLLVLSLTGCGTAASMKDVAYSPPPPPVVQETAPPPAPPQAAEPVVHYQVETQVWSDAAAAEDGTPLVECSYDLPVMTPVREDGTAVVEARNSVEERALQVAAAFNAKFEDWTEAEDFTEVTTWAREHLASVREIGAEWYTPYTLEMDCTVYQTELMVSVSGLYYSYTGGAHPNTYHLAWNFDLDTATFFDPKLLGSGTDFQEVVAAELVRQANQPQEDYVPTEMYWEDYETIMADWPSYAVSFDETGMTVTFSPYELAPYAAGPQSFHLTNDWLEGHLSQQGRLLLGMEEAPQP